MHLRDTVIFAAGAEFFHTISHIGIAYTIQLPLDLKFMQLTSSINSWGIGINAVITIFLLIWARKLK